jgi:uncharacterized membrane protein YdfJ with MMPL/SSD domain
VLTAVTVGAALLADLLLLPALLHIVGRRRWSGWSRVGPVTPEPS